MKPKETLLARIGDRSALIGIVGLGYVGLPLMSPFVEQSFRVLGFDVDAERVALLNAGEHQLSRHHRRTRTAKLVDIFEVVRAAATRPFGFVPYYHAPGLAARIVRA